MAATISKTVQCPLCHKNVIVADFGDGEVLAEHWLDDGARCSMSRHPLRSLPRRSTTAVGEDLRQAVLAAHAA